MVVDNPYSVQFKVDIPLEIGTHNYAGHKITDIKIAPFEDVGGQITIPYKHLKDAISNISLAVLRGKVNPARYDSENALEILAKEFKIAKKPQKIHLYNATEIKIPPISGKGRNFVKREMGGNMDTISQSDENVKFEQRAYSGEFSQLRDLPKKKKTIKGEFSALKKSIDFTKDADYSTLSHEFAHFWLDNIWNYVESGLASKEYLEQFNEVRKFLGLKKEWGVFFLIKRKSY